MFDPSQVPLFALAERKLAWLDQRQQVLSRNIANADTPDWHARDLRPFASLLAARPVALARTADGHMAAPADGRAEVVTPQAELAPDGNGVSLDRELMKVADTDMAQELTTDLTKAWLGMMRTAIGR